MGYVIQFGTFKSRPSIHAARIRIRLTTLTFQLFRIQSIVSISIFPFRGAQNEGMSTQHARNPETAEKRDADMCPHPFNIAAESRAFSPPKITGSGCH